MYSVRGDINQLSTNTFNYSVWCAPLFTFLSKTVLAPLKIVILTFQELLPPWKKEVMFLVALVCCLFVSLFVCLFVS